MKPIKYFWAIRAILYKLSFKHIGFRTYIGRPLYVDGTRRISIGDRTRIFPLLRMEAIDNGEIRIGNNTVIEQGVHIISMGDSLYIGDDVTIGPHVFITNVNHEYADINKSVMDQGFILRKTRIGDGCFIGYGAAIQAGTVLGKHCVIGSNSVVHGEYPDYCVIVGNPARIIKKYSIDTKTWNKI